MMTSPGVAVKAVKRKIDFDPNNFLATIGEGRRILSFRKNQGIFAQGDEADAVFFIQAGKVKLSVFAKNGVSRIKSVGERLDPNRHQAMMEIPTDQADPGTIVEEMQPGYMLKDRLLRPALVGVAKKPWPDPPPTRRTLLQRG